MQDLIDRNRDKLDKATKSWPPGWWIPAGFVALLLVALSFWLGGVLL